MKGQDLLLSLATNFGFDEEAAKQCLDRFLDLYGTKFESIIYAPIN